MKDIDPKNPPEASGGLVSDNGCFPPFPLPIDSPLYPIDPILDPMTRPASPAPFVPLD